MNEAAHVATVVEEIRAALAAIAPDGVRVGAGAIAEADPARLHRIEREAIANARPGRRQEFAAGRELLRALLGDDAPIPVKSNRAPLLPVGHVGSLAHDRGVVVAAVSDDPSVHAIGVDIEPLVELDQDSIDLIRQPAEARLDPIIVHSAKEAVFKAWAADRPDLLEYGEVQLRGSGNEFTAIVTGDRSRFRVRVGMSCGRCVTLVVVRTGT
jgi:4'-phosphopantetheinyl transferase EntD